MRTIARQVLTIAAGAGLGISGVGLAVGWLGARRADSARAAAAQGVGRGTATAVDSALARQRSWLG